MSAELQVDPIGAKRGHAKKQDNRNHGDQYVGDDQAIPQPPEQVIANPGQQPNHKINHRDEAEKEQQAGEWKTYARKGKEAKD